jgi:hypothetical protein
VVWVHVQIFTHNFIIDGQVIALPNPLPSLNIGMDINGDNIRATNIDINLNTSPIMSVEVFKVTRLFFKM